MKAFPILIGLGAVALLASGKTESSKKVIFGRDFNTKGIA